MNSDSYVNLCLTYVLSNLSVSVNSSVTHIWFMSIDEALSVIYTQVSISFPGIQISGCEGQVVFYSVSYSHALKFCSCSGLYYSFNSIVYIIRYFAMIDLLCELLLVRFFFNQSFIHSTVCFRALSFLYLFAIRSGIQMFKLVLNL